MCFFSLALSIESQLLYATCRPIYAVLTRLNEKQIEELKRDPSKYQSPQNANMRKVSITRRVGPACKTRSRSAVYAQNTSVSSKRKAPVGDESDPIVVEDDEVISQVLTASTEEALTASNAVKSFTGKMEPTRSTREKKSGTRSAIILIDLCSSDDEEKEEDQSTVIPCDENKDPMNSAESPKFLLRKLTPNNKHYAKSYIYPAASSTERGLSNHVLNGDKNENCTNKCRTGMLNGCVHLSTILRPAP